MDKRMLARIWALADVLVLSAARAHVKPNASAESGAPERVLSDAVELAIGFRNAKTEDIEALKEIAFSQVVYPYRRRATVCRNQAVETLPLVGDVYVACGWLAEVVKEMSQPTPHLETAEEASRNVLDACVRMHVFTGRRASEVTKLMQKRIAVHSKGN